MIILILGPLKSVQCVEHTFIFELMILTLLPLKSAMCGEYTFFIEFMRILTLVPLKYV